MPRPSIDEPVSENFPLYTPAYVRRAHEYAEQAVADAHVAALEAERGIKAIFPNWKVETEACADSPVWGVVHKACTWNADLIVIGAQELPARGQFTLQDMKRIVHEAPCSVHIAREPRQTKTSPELIVVGLDVSPVAESVIRAVATRNWPSGSTVRLIISAHPLGRYKIGSKSQTSRLEDIQQAAETKLRLEGLNVSSAAIQGNPELVLVDEAKTLGADCIFVGGDEHGFFKLIHRSTALAVAAHAHCSVEIVRVGKT